MQHAAGGKTMRYISRTSGANINQKPTGEHWANSNRVIFGISGSQEQINKAISLIKSICKTVS